MNGLLVVMISVRQEAGTLSMERLWREGPTYWHRTGRAGQQSWQPGTDHRAGVVPCPPRTRIAA